MRRFRTILVELMYQRQFLDVMQSEFAVWNLSCLDVIWMKRSSSVCPISGGLQPTFFARNDCLFGKQLFYEYQNEHQHN